MMRIGTPRFFALISAVTKRLSLKNQTPTSIPCVSLLMSVISEVRQLVDEASQSVSSAEAFTAEQTIANNSRARMVTLRIRVISRTRTNATYAPETDVTAT